MNDNIKVIHRNPQHAGTKPVMHKGMPMRTLDPQRLGRGGVVERRESKPLTGVTILGWVVMVVLLCLALTVASLVVAVKVGGM